MEKILVSERLTSGLNPFLALIAYLFRHHFSVVFERTELESGFWKKSL